MAYSTQRAVSTGAMAYLDLSILYLSRNDISVFYNSIPAAPGTWAWVGTTDKRITFSPVIANGVEVLVKRTTRLDQQINIFAAGAKFNNATMDTNFTQVIYLNQEAVEGGQLSDVFNILNMHGNKIINVGNATLNTDAVNYGQVLTMSNGAYTSSLAAAASAAAALASQNLAQAWASQLTTTVDGTSYSAKQYALNAGISAAAALGSQNAAAASATTATTQAGIATTKAAAAAASATAADLSDQHATTIAADVLNIQQNAQDAIDIANTFDGRLTTAEGNASTALSTANSAASDAAAAVSTANGIAGTANTALTNSSTALALAQYGPVAQCYLAITGTTCILGRKNGIYLMINGVPRAIPSAGITMTATGAVANTTYAIYASWNGTTIVLEFSATGFVVDTTTGMPIKSGDATRTLVGYGRATATNSFAAAANNVTIISYFNRRTRTLSQGVGAVGVGAGSVVFASVAGLTWADDVMWTVAQTTGALTTGTAATVQIVVRKAAASITQPSACSFLSASATNGFSSQGAAAGDQSWSVYDCYITNNAGIYTSASAAVILQFQG